MSLQVPVALEDVAEYLSQKEWGRLDPAQQDRSRDTLPEREGNVGRPWLLTIRPALGGRGSLPHVGCSWPGISPRCIFPSGPKTQATSPLTPSLAPSCLQESV